MLGVIRVFTTADDAIVAAHGQLIASLFGLETRSYCIPDQPLGIYDAASHQQAVPKIVAAAKKAAEDGAKAVFISCAADPGVQECRQVLSIPVIGAGSAAAGIGLAMGPRVGVLNLTGSTPPAIAGLLGKHLAAEAAPQGVRNTTDLLNQAGMSAAIEAANILARSADVIVLACTGYSTIGLAKVLRSIVGVPIVDAVEAGGTVAFYCLARRMA